MTYCNEDTNADKLAAYDYALEAKALEIYNELKPSDYKSELIEVANNSDHLNELHDDVIMGKLASTVKYGIAMRHFVDTWLMAKATELAEKELANVNKI